MEVTLDAGYDDASEIENNFTQTHDLFCLGGRVVSQEVILNNTDEKTVWICKSKMQRGGGNVEAGVHIKTGPGKGIEITAYAQGDYSDNKGNYVKINADVDKKGNADVNISSGYKFGKNNGQ